MRCCDASCSSGAIFRDYQVFRTAHAVFHPNSRMVWGAVLMDQEMHTLSAKAPSPQITTLSRMWFLSTRGCGIAVAEMHKRLPGLYW